MEEIKNEDIAWLFIKAGTEEAEKFLSEHRNWDKVNKKINHIWKVIDRSLEKLGKTRNDLEKEIYSKNDNKDEHVSEQIENEAKNTQDENKDEISQAETAVSSDSEENKEIGLSIHGCAYLACKTAIVALLQTVVLEEKIKSAWKNQSDPVAKAFFKKHFTLNQDEINGIVEKNSALICLLNPEYRKIVTENLELGRGFKAVFENITSSVFKLSDKKDLKSLDMRLIVELVNNKDAFDFYNKVFEKAIKIYPETTQSDAKRFLGILGTLKKDSQDTKTSSDVAKYVFVIGTIAFAIGIPLGSILMVIPTIISGAIAALSFGLSENSKDKIKSIDTIKRPLTKIKLHDKKQIQELKNINQSNR